MTEFAGEGPEIFSELHTTRLGVIVHLHCQVGLIFQGAETRRHFFKGPGVQMT